jgi:DNA-binding PadR family transcriptional regulator
MEMRMHFGNHRHRGVRGPRHGDPFEGHGWGGGREHGRHFGGRGGHRLFEHGDLRLVALALLGEKPRHGYDIIKEIETRIGGGYAPSPGVIYPLLTMLEEIGAVRLEAADGGKKLYALTPTGEAEVAENKAHIDALFARIAMAREQASAGRAPQIVRAMENLRMALRLRFEQGAIGEREAQAIAAALDAAAIAVERAGKEIDQD